ncbi:MAG: hypothetical protein JNL92_18735 [Opitutaceae bacterium]|nr:hypothetical protein [Opitutaceae bacterium]
MIADTLGSVLLFTLLLAGVGWPLAARLACTPAERLVAGVALSWFGVFLVAWVVYVAALPHVVFWLLPLAAVAGAAVGGRAWRDVWRDPAAREMIVAQGVVTAWSIGWLALVATYSGGAWVGDWFGHMQRTDFFLTRGPRDVLFNGFDALTSRPPLANVVFGAFLALTRSDFAHYQLSSTFLGSLAFLPAALLVRRFLPGTAASNSDAARPAIRILVALFLVSPMFAQNATFAWTKLHAAFFTLASFHFLLRTSAPDFPRAGILCAVTLGAALLTHYSAGPYALVFAVVWIARGAGRWREAAWWRETLVAAAAGFAVLATWFGWALAVYGPKGTFLTNSSVTDKAATAGAQVLAALLNVRDTLVPHFLREVNWAFFLQQSPWGWWRDWFFQLYQINFVFIFGSVAWLVILVALRSAGAAAPGRIRAAWTAGLVTIAVLGVMVHGGRDGWGLAHICLQPLVLLGLVFLAARWETLAPGWRRLAIAGATADVALGILLQFGAQSFLLDQWFAPHRTPAETFASYSPHALVNWRAKLHFRRPFFGDAYAAYDVVILALLALLLVLVLWRANRRHARA